MRQTGSGKQRIDALYKCVETIAELNADRYYMRLYNCYLYQSWNQDVPAPSLGKISLHFYQISWKIEKIRAADVKQGPFRLNGRKLRVEE